MRIVTLAIRCCAAFGPSTLAASTALAQPVSAPSYCASRGHEAPQKTPPELLPVLQKAFSISPSLARDATYVRCVGPALMGCFVGANLSCAKADTRRTLPGATAFCRQSPNVDVVPMAATGHGTIYDWSCKGQRAVAGNATTAVDAQGYIASNWQQLK